MREIFADVLVAEIGSTTTVVSAFSSLDTPEPVLLGQGQSPTTVVQGDVTRGLRDAVAGLQEALGGQVLCDHMLASSSAAGGLRMTVHGLVYDMTVKAAQEAALGAGAVLKYVTAGDLADSDLERVKAIAPNIILLAGGVDYGEKATVTGNARKIASLGLRAPVVYAGNIAAKDEVSRILEGAGLTVIETQNVYPRIDELNIEPTRRVIQSVFEQHIVSAPGMEKIRTMVKGAILPTPGAVMNAAMLLYEDLGDLMVIDIGGATTDVHSVTEGSPEVQDLMISPEPVAKRTVEGDLGIYVNAQNVVQRIGLDRLAQDLGFDPAPVLDAAQVIPETPEEIALVERLALEALTHGVRRHAGRIKHLYGPAGRTTVAEGKDLTRVKHIIGTGGPLTRLPRGRELLATILEKRKGTELYPKEADILIDSEYIMAACGVLARECPAAARVLLRKSLGVASC